MFDEIKHIILNVTKKEVNSSIDKDKLLAFFKYLKPKDDYKDNRTSNYFLAKAAELKQEDNTNSFLSKLQSKRLLLGLSAAISIVVVIFLVHVLLFTPFAKVVSKTGKTFVLRNGKTLSLENDDHVYANDVIITSKKAKIILSMKSQLSCQISPQSTLKLIDKSKNITMFLQKGKAYYHVFKNKKNRIVSIYTPNSVAEVKGTLFSIKIYNDEVQHSVYEGKLFIKNRISFPLNNNNSVLNSFFKKQGVLVTPGKTCITSNQKKLFKTQKKIIHANYRKPKIFRFSLQKHKEINEIDLFANTIAKSTKNKTIKKIISPFVKKMENKKEVIIWQEQLKAEYLHYNNKYNILVAIHKNGRIDATNLEKMIWKVQTSSIASTPIIINNYIYILTQSAIFQIIDIRTGNILVNKNYSNRITNPHLSIYQNYAIVYGNVKKGSKSYLYILTSWGRLIKRIEVQGDIISKPLFSKNKICIPLNNSLSIVNIRNGIEIKNYYLTGNIEHMQMYNGLLYIGTNTGKLYQLNIINLRKNWEIDFNSQIHQILLNDNSIFLAKSNGEIYKLKNTGELNWNISVGSLILSKISIEQNLLYFTGERTLYVIDKHNGDIKWSVVTSELISKNIALSHGKIFLISKRKGLIVLNR